MSKKKIRTIIILSFLLLIFVLAGQYAYQVYTKIYEKNVESKGVVYIPTGADFDEFLDSLYASNLVADTAGFAQTAMLKGFNKKVYPGRYVLKSGMTNAQIVNKFQNGLQDPVKLTFNSIRTKEQFAGKVAKKIEADSSSIAELLNNEAYVSEFGFDTKNIISMFLPDSYEFYWNTSAKSFIKRMNKEYKKFWTEERLQKAKALNLTPQQVSVLASVVQAEQLQHPSERAKIAGLYINRLKKGMLLQSDPTLIFAIGDFSKKRVLNKDKEINSPYNTYKHVGLPPGPINMPDKSSIDAVLNYQKHDYIYMCAKDDFSGYHNFATNLTQHNINARKYQNALNKQKIYK